MKVTSLLTMMALTSGAVAADQRPLAALWIEGQALFYDLKDLESLSHRLRRADRDPSFRRLVSVLFQNEARLFERRKKPVSVYVGCFQHLQELIAR